MRQLKEAIHLHPSRIIAWLSERTANSSAGGQCRGILKGTGLLSGYSQETGQGARSKELDVVRDFRCVLRAS
jgi:hypothetical protein